MGKDVYFESKTNKEVTPNDYGKSSLIDLTEVDPETALASLKRNRK